MLKGLARKSGSKPAPESFSGFQLTFPAETAAMVRDRYAKAATILEYGSGGSTFLALQSGAGFVMSVESDRGWAETIDGKLGEAFDRDRFRIHHADIGKTRKWGNPADASGFQRYHLYPLGVFDQPWYRQPDLVLIDGRFRTACFVAAMLKTTRPVEVLFDDYFRRPHYHWVEEFFRPVETAGRMARFEVEPRPFPLDRLTKILEAHVDPR
jgi:hypothetical protein